METDVELYPHVWDNNNKTWHRRTGTGESDGPDYLTRCGKTVRSFMVDEPQGGPEGFPEEWEKRCRKCYP